MLSMHIFQCLVLSTKQILKCFRMHISVLKTNFFNTRIFTLQLYWVSMANYVSNVFSTYYLFLVTVQCRYLLFLFMFFFFFYTTIIFANYLLKKSIWRNAYNIAIAWHSLFIVYRKYDTKTMYEKFKHHTYIVVKPKNTLATFRNNILIQ